MKFEWEEIENNSQQSQENWWSATYRAKVFGGWLIRYECAFDYRLYDHTAKYKEISEEWNKREYNMIFIPDPGHKWEIDKE